MKSPVVDEDVGVAASIRIVNRHNLSREDLLRSGTATEEMLDWLSVFLRYGISICVAGATSSGKTTAAGWLLTTIPDPTVNVSSPSRTAPVSWSWCGRKMERWSTRWSTP